MNSTEMIQAADVDYKMLKEKGKEGEEVLHYNGFLDGSAYGFTEAKRYYIDKACEEYCNRCPAYADDLNGLQGCGKRGCDVLRDFRKAMEE